MTKLQTNDIDFYALQRDTADASAQIAEDAQIIQQAVVDGDVTRSIDTAIDMRNLGGAVNDDVANDMETLILDKGTDQQKLDYAIELAPILGRDITTIYDHIQGLSDEDKSKLIGLKALKRQQALQQLIAMFPNMLANEASEELENANGMARMMMI